MIYDISDGWVAEDFLSSHMGRKSRRSLPTTPNAGRYIVPQQVDTVDLFCLMGGVETHRGGWVVWRYHALASQRRGHSQECPRGARMALKDYSDNEAVRSRGQDLVSTVTSVVNITGVDSNQDLMWCVKIGIYAGF